MTSGWKYNVSQPQILQEDKDMVMAALNEGMISHAGKNVNIFEKEFAEAHKASYGVSCNSGTNALYLALKALGVGPGDEVIVPEFTMIATAYAVSYTGAVPVFVDCDSTLNIDPDLIEQSISKRTKVIIPVHIYGRVANMDRILEIARQYGLKVVEDSAEAISTPLRGDIACFSLFANKVITTGEGGMCVTNDFKLAVEMEHLANMAFDPDHSFLHSKIAHNFRMTNLQASLGLSQLRRLDTILKKRKQIEGWYDSYLKIVLEPERDVVWMYDVQVPNRDEVLEHLTAAGIQTRLYFKPMSMQRPYRSPSYKFLKAYDYSTEGFYLPTYTDLTEEDVKYICEQFRGIAVR